MINNIFKKPCRMVGHKLVFRNASVEDAEFIVKLRTDEKKSRYISSTSDDVRKQIEWLQSYEHDEEQVYFIIEDANNEPLGTVRLYNQVASSFCWGSWILKDGTPPAYAMESALMVYAFALELGFNASHFDVRRDNKSVWRFHERFGATRYSESEIDYFYKITNESIHDSLVKYTKFLPDGIKLEW